MPGDEAAPPEPAVEQAFPPPPSPPDPPPAAAPAPERRLSRRPEGKVIAGVCTGLAEYLAVDVVVVRIAFVLTAIFGGGLGVLAYIVAWLVMPLAPEGQPAAPRAPRDDASTGRWIGIGAIALGAIVLFNNVWDFRGGIFWGLLLIGIGVALWGRELTRPNPPTGSADVPQPPVPPAPPESSLAATAPVRSTQPVPPVPPAPPVPVPPVPPAGAAPTAPAPSPARTEPSVLGRAVVGAAALAVGIALLLGNTTSLDVSPKAIVAVLLLIVGGGLIVGSRWGRARWLIVPGLVLTALLALLAVLPDWRLDDGAGERLYRPDDLAELRSSYRLGAGELRLDLSELDLDGSQVDVAARVGFGELAVIVPDDVRVVATARASVGEVDLFGRTQGGLGRVGETVVDGDEDEGTIRLVARVGFGEITLRRASDVTDLGLGRRRHADEFREAARGPGYRELGDRDFAGSRR